MNVVKASNTKTGLTEIVEHTSGVKQEVARDAGAKASYSQNAGDHLLTSIKLLRNRSKLFSVKVSY